MTVKGIYGLAIRVGAGRWAEIAWRVILAEPLTGTECASSSPTRTTEDISHAT